MGTAVHPASYSVPDDIRATVVRILVYMGGLAALAAAAASYFQSTTGLTALNPAPLPTWTSVERPYPAFELVMPDLAGGVHSYAILRHSRDGARKDVLTWGELAENQPYAVVEIFRPGPRGERFLDASSEIAARIIDYTVTDDVKAAGQLDSKFGPVPLVDFAAAPRGAVRRCLGFARPFDNPAMQIAGWYCSAGQEVVDRTTVACLLDRLTIVSGDSQLGAFFARAELKRKFCGQRNPILAATPEREEHVFQPRSTKPQAVNLRGRFPQR
jgi:hypothetical protein